jgi:hypothetical protein
MASFEAHLIIGSETYILRSCSFSFSQQIRESGQPGSDVHAGTIHCEWPEDYKKKDVTLMQWARDPRKFQDGSIKFFDDSEEGQSYRDVEFKNATIVQFTSNFNSGGQGLVTHFTISAEELNIGEVKYKNKKWETKLA